MNEEQQSGGDDAFDRLLDAANPETLRLLVRHLAERPKVRRLCLEYLRERQSGDTVSEADTAAEIVFALWDELQFDLDELDDYGGDYEAIHHVGGLLHDLSEKLTELEVPVDARRAMMDAVMPYIRSGNSGLEDLLYEVAHSLCKTEDDWRDFAERLEATGRHWPCTRARRIYRSIGDREKYLQLRHQCLELGVDYHDLATFYWKSGEKDNALAVAWEGLDNARGSIDDLREFLAERARESGDRATYLELEFAQATDCVSLEKYKKFRKLCSKSEWAEYEPRMMTCVYKAHDSTQLQIYMYRKDFEAAIDVLSELQYPISSSFPLDHAILKAAAQLEAKFPEKVLAYYMTGLQHVGRTANRKEYAHFAQCAKLARRVWVDVLNKPNEWEAFARKIKLANARRPAFQHEFAKVVPGWENL